MPDLPGHERDGADYERLVEAVGDGVYALDEDGRFVDVNESIVAMTGYERGEIIAAGLGLWHDRADVYRFENAIRTLVTGDDTTAQTVEAMLETAEGDRIPIEVTITLLQSDDGEYQGHVGVVRDVSERKRRQTDLEKYETIVRAMPDEIYTLDEEGCFTSLVPPAGSETLTGGYTAEELLGEHVSTVMDEADLERGQEVVRELVENEDRERASFEMKVVTKDGRHIPHENHVALLPMEGTGFQGTVGVLRDISDRKTRERTLERQNERLEQFANVVSHDLRNPLNVASATLALLQEDYDDDRHDRVASAHERMGTIIEDVLALAREGAAVEDPETVSLREIARFAWSSVQTEEATVGVTGDLDLRADTGRFGRLLENLYRNAIEHGGPAVTVTLGPIPSDDGCLSGFFVEDDGPGISPDVRDEIFASGYTGDDTGTGLGLAIVERIADAHGWQVRVTDGTAGGARFEFAGVDVA